MGDSFKIQQPGNKIQQAEAGLRHHPHAPIPPWDAWVGVTTPALGPGTLGGPEGRGSEWAALSNANDHFSRHSPWPSKTHKTLFRSRGPVSHSRHTPGPPPRPRPDGCVGPSPTGCSPEPSEGLSGHIPGSSLKECPIQSHRPETEAQRVSNLPKVTQRSEAELELKPGAWAANPPRRWCPIHNHRVAARLPASRHTPRFSDHTLVFY